MLKGDPDWEPAIAQEVDDAYAQWSDGLYRLARRMTGNREDAEDIVVETFVEAMRNWHRFDANTSRRNWLYGIAVNRCRMNRRRKKENEALTEEILSPHVEPLDALMMEEALARLPRRQRESLFLMKGEGFTAKEASEILHRPPGTVLYEVHLAVKTLYRKVFGDEEQPVIDRLCETEP